MLFVIILFKYILIHIGIRFFACPIMIGCLQPFFSYDLPYLYQFLCVRLSIALLLFFLLSFIMIFMPTLKLLLWLYLLFNHTFCDFSFWITFNISSRIDFFGMPHYVRLSIACILLLSTFFFINFYLRLYLLFF